MSDNELMLEEVQGDETFEKADMGGCLLCGKAIKYESQGVERTCAICQKSTVANAVCVDNHFVCDTCHSGGIDVFLPLLQKSKERSPFRILQQVFINPEIHMHGPEHHHIIPCVLLTAYHNNGGDLDLENSLQEALNRGKQIPGGACGFWGACGTAIGAGIYASVVTGSNPLKAETWHVPPQLTARCLTKMAEIGGPRCCKRASMIAIETAIEFTKENLGVTIPEERLYCNHAWENKECIGNKCPYFTGRIAM